VDGASRVRQVHVLNNVVRTNRVGATSGVAVTGQILVGRGQGAITLRGLEVGQKVRVASALSVQSPQVAISGSAQLMRAGKVVTADNGELHPRTAVGIDRDKGLIHLLVADGRSPSSAGLTLRQLADVMNGLGDEDVLNLDGGGSSTLVAPNHTGLVGVRNTPSDGHERAIPNGLGFRYTAPQAGWMSPDAGAGER
jgi:exopolysaccharide biosynthesis protein